MEERNSLYQLIKSRNDLTVPVIKGVHLHSKYNPLKEAEAFAQGFSEAINRKSKILIFGLGFGYHVDAIAELASKVHESFEIIVIEPNHQLVRDFLHQKGFEQNNISIICEENIQKLFESVEFVKFLFQKPCIIKHDTSFNMQKDYYSKFLTYSSSEKIEDFLHLIENDLFKDYLLPYKGSDLDYLSKSIIKNGHINNKNDFAMLAMAELFNTKVD